MRKMVLEDENQGLDSVRFRAFGRSADDWIWISRSSILSVGACGATFWGTFDPTVGGQFPLFASGRMIARYATLSIVPHLQPTDPPRKAISRVADSLLCLSMVAQRCIRLRLR